MKTAFRLGTLVSILSIFYVAAAQADGAAPGGELRSLGSVASSADLFVPSRAGLRVDHQDFHVTARQAAAARVDHQDFHVTKFQGDVLPAGASRVDHQDFHIAKLTGGKLGPAAKVQIQGFRFVDGRLAK